MLLSLTEQVRRVRSSKRLTRLIFELASHHYSTDFTLDTTRRPCQSNIDSSLTLSAAWVMHATEFRIQRRRRLGCIEGWQPSTTEHRLHSNCK